MFGFRVYCRHRFRIRHLMVRMVLMFLTRPMIETCLWLMGFGRRGIRPNSLASKMARRRIWAVNGLQSVGQTGLRAEYAAGIRGLVGWLHYWSSTNPVVYRCVTTSLCKATSSSSWQYISWSSRFWRNYWDNTVFGRTNCLYIRRSYYLVSQLVGIASSPFNKKTVLYNRTFYS